jgi:hypothetical protein
MGCLRLVRAGVGLDGRLPGALPCGCARPAAHHNADCRGALWAERRLRVGFQDDGPGWARRVPTEGGDIPEEPDSPEATAEQALELGWQRAERLAMGFASAPAPPAPAPPVARAQRSAPPAGRQRPHADARTLAVVRPLPAIAGYNLACASECVRRRPNATRAPVRRWACLPAPLKYTCLLAAPEPRMQAAGACYQLLGSKLECLGIASSPALLCQCCGARRGPVICPHRCRGTQRRSGAGAPSRVRPPAATRGRRARRSASRTSPPRCALQALAQGCARASAGACAASSRLFVAKRVRAG